ncbi:metal-sulfur cluster assembly factor [Devosia sp. YIM 151766]|uniref:metal-sulfur cluster assembly factor n=1 Tax=Devosia sp. YIM 151766 TaxID=3017325 RepID=UPI00255CB6A0|nr:metal-sulfur cluster assembly factor [Devosia sp. YIM 151766]WIY52364.1 metal-sulfur cluster assembly factor [Devosia sp. YIM 151766]
MNMAPGPELEAAIRAALRAVIDPELGHNIIDLGMVYAIDVDSDGAVLVLMTTTARFCPASGFLQEAVSERAAEVEGVTRVRVELTYDPPWTPERMAPEIAVRF